MHWEKLGERTLYEGWRHVLGRTFRLPNGDEREFEVKVEAPTAVVLPLRDDEQVVLVREFRPGLELSLLELPGGEVEPGEDPREAARRELLEETGYEGELVEAGTMFDCAYSTRVRHVFVAHGCRQVAEPRPEDGEAPEVELMPLDAFREHVRGGRLTDVGPGYLALDRLGLL
jgi:ADP-ribose pyrophosphatase